MNKKPFKCPKCGCHDVMEKENTATFAYAWERLSWKKCNARRKPNYYRMWPIPEYTIHYSNYIAQL